MLPATARRVPASLLWVLAVSTALGHASAISAPAPPRVLRGQILTADGRPAAGATVRILRLGLSMDQRDRPTTEWAPPRVVQTDDQGNFTAEELTGSKFVVRASAPEHAPTTVSSIPLGASLTLHLEAGHTVRGRVLDADTRRPVARATVVVCDVASFHFGRDACPSSETDETGSFLFDAAPEGELHVRAQAARYAVSAIAQTEAPMRMDGVLTLELRPGAAVEGRVVDEKQQPVADARVYVRPLALSLADLVHIDAGWPDHSDDEGKFSLAGVRSGAKYTVHAFRSDRGVASTEPITVATGQDLGQVQVVLPHPAVVTLRLVDEEDAALTEFALFLRETTEERSSAFAPLDASWIDRADDGHFKLRVPGRNGSYDLLFVPEGFADILRADVELAPGRVSDLGTLVGVQGLSVAGAVLDDAGEPIENATVEASWSTGETNRIRRAVTDDAGYFEVTGLGESLVRLEASAEGYLSSGLDAVSPGAEAADFALQPLGGVSGHLELEDGEIPLAFTVVVHVEAESAAEAPERYTRFPHEETFQSEDGAFRIDDIPSGRYTIEGRSSGWATDRKPGIEVSGGKWASVPTLVLREGLQVLGRVVALEDEKPLPGTEVEARPERSALFGSEMDDRRSAVADEEGAFRVPGLEPGSVIVRALHPEFAPSEQRVELQEGADDAELIFRLSAGGTLAGTVRDVSGDLSPGRRIGVERERSVEVAITDAEGRYELRRMMAGNYSASLLPEPGSLTQIHMKSVVVREGDVTILDFDEARRISLSGIVYREEQPLAGAEMFFADTFSLTDFSVARADSEGRYSIGLDGPGRYRVLLQSGPSNSQGGASTEIDVPDRDHVILDIHVGGDGISGTVQDTEGRPLVGAVISAKPDGVRADESRFLVAATDARGNYSIQGLLEGRYRVTASATGHRVGIAYPVEILEGRTASSVDFALEPGQFLRGRVVDDSGRGLAATPVVAGPAGSIDTWGAASAVTDINGSFQLTAPSAGPIDVTALPAGWAPIRLTGVLPPERDDEAEMVLRAGRGGALRVRVVGPEGKPRSAVRLSLRAVPPFLGSELIQLLSPPAPTDSSGSTRIEHALPWNYEILVPGADAGPVPVTVQEGSETAVRVEIP